MVETYVDARCFESVARLLVAPVMVHKESLLRLVLDVGEAGELLPSMSSWLGCRCCFCIMTVSTVDDARA